MISATIIRFASTFTFMYFNTESIQLYRSDFSMFNDMDKFTFNSYYLLVILSIRISYSKMI